jgi:hypothetical protein
LAPVLKLYKSVVFIGNSLVVSCYTLHRQRLYIRVCGLDTIQDFLIELDMKPCKGKKISEDITLLVRSTIFANILLLLNIFQYIGTRYPSLNTQSCIKGLLVVQDFCFWANKFSDFDQWPHMSYMVQWLRLSAVEW